VDDSPNALAEAEAADAAGLPLPEVPACVRAAYKQRHEEYEESDVAAGDPAHAGAMQGQRAHEPAQELSVGHDGSREEAGPTPHAQLQLGDDNKLGGVSGRQGSGGEEGAALDNLFTELMQAEDPVTVAARRVSNRPHV
jgi:hypothetical protein